MGYQVVGVGDLNDYYDPKLKLARLRELGIDGINWESEDIYKFEVRHFTFLKADIID